jgi:hypothetical protein
MKSKVISKEEKAEKEVIINEYLKAIDIQNASNLSAIAREFDNAFNVLWMEAHKNGLGTDYVNSHPIVMLYISKLISLSGYNDVKFGDAYNEAMKILKR